MASNKGYRSVPFGINRRIMAATLSVNRERNNIHLITEIDVTIPRRIIAEHHERTGEKLSMTAYVTACLARTCAEFPQFNSFRKGRRLIILNDVTVNVLFEREFSGEIIPEPLGIRCADQKDYREISRLFREAKAKTGDRLGSASKTAWVRFIPEFLMKSFVRAASSSITMQKRFGVVAVTSVGMFGGQTPMWPVPLTAATTTAAIGTIVHRPVQVEGRIESREHICITLSFNHDIIDGAPAARFAARFAELVQNGELMQNTP